MSRLKLYEEIQEQIRILELHRLHEEHEQVLAKELLSRIAQLDGLNDFGIEYVVSPLGIFNGDMLLADHTPYGALRVMLGDFTGHGLPAAVGTLPVAETFYEMTAKGFQLGAVVNEINSKLYRILPTELFCAAALIELNSESKQLSIWNGGLPHLLLFHGGDNKVRHVFRSEHLALGILPPENFDANLCQTIISPADSLIAYSDGVVETKNQAGELYGDHRLISRLSEKEATTSQFQSIMHDLKSFRGYAAQSDDYTLIEIPCGLISQAESVDLIAKPFTKPASKWSQQLTLTGKALAEVDPIPLLIQSMVHIQGLENFREDLFTILTELYNNALEHGVLKLDSSIKCDAEGFAEYYRLREERLQAIKDGEITIQLHHSPARDGGLLTICVKDSGSGFDIASIFEKSASSAEFSGRGISLVQSLCSSLEYNAKGSEAKATYYWRYTWIIDKTLIVSGG